MRPVLALLLLSACGSSRPAPTPAPTPEVTPSAPEPAPEPPPEVPAATTGPTLPDGAVRLRALETAISVPVGTTLALTWSEHGSVGEGVELSHEGEAVRLVSRDTTYRTPERLQAGMTGADAADGLALFEATAEGTATITLAEVFRGQEQGRTTWTVTVTPAE